MDIFGIFVKLQ